MLVRLRQFPVPNRECPTAGGKIERSCYQTEIPDVPGPSHKRHNAFY